MRSYLTATLIVVLFFTAIGRLMAESPQPLTESDKNPVAESEPEVLRERTDFGHNVVFGGRAFIFNSELTRDREKKQGPEWYSLSSVTVPEGGWRIDAVAIYTNPSQPADWHKVERARLNVIAKKGDLPHEAEDPRQGREGQVAVREAEDDAI